MAVTKSHNGLNRGVSDPANYTDAADSDDIRRDIDRTRCEMDRTIDQLSERLRPRNLFDDLIDSVRCSILGPSTTATGQQRMMSEQVTEAASRAGRTLLEAVRENPVPAALMGAGLAWLLFEDKAERAYRRRRIESNVRGYTGDRFTDPGTYSGSYVDARTGQPYDASYGAGYADTNFDGEPDVCPPSLMDKAASAASSVKETLGSAAHAIGSAAGTVGDVASRAAEGVKCATTKAAQAASSTGRSLRSAGQTVGDYGRTAGSSIRGAGSAVRDTARQTGSSVREYGTSAAERLREASRTTACSVAELSQSAAESARVYGRKASEGVNYGYAVSRERFNTALDEKPMAVGIAALAAGVLAGFALPNTRVEDRTLGRRSDQLKDEARRRAQEALDQGKEVVSHVADTALGEVEGANLTPGSLGEKVARVARETLSAAQQAAQDAARREGLDAGTLADKAKQIGQAVKEKGKEELKQVAAALPSGQEMSGDACVTGASASLGASDLASTDFGVGLTGGDSGGGDISSVKEDAEVKHDIAEGMSASSGGQTKKGKKNKGNQGGDSCRC